MPGHREAAITCCALFATLLLAAVGTTQEYTVEPVATLGIKVRVHKRLAPVPLELGSGQQNVIELHRRARFDPKSQQQSIMKGPQPFKWGMDVFAFDPAPKFDGEAKTQDEVRERAAITRRYEAGARNFEQLVKSKDPRSSTYEFHGRGGASGKPVKSRGGAPDHVYWEYSHPDETDGDPKIAFRWYSVAAAYQLPEREVALVFTWPIFKDKPDDKYLKIAQTMVASLQLDDSARAGAVDDQRAKHADTPEREQIVAAAVASITGIEGWEWFTTPGCLVIFSSKSATPDPDVRKRADAIAEHLSAVQELYRTHFPPWDGMPEPWPVLRVCHDRDALRRYCNPPRGAESAYNAAAGEVVVMLGGEQDPSALAAREGFRHYAALCFRGASPSAWLAHGFGDWFACWTRSGKRWSFEPNKRCIDGPDGVAALVKRGEHAPLSEFTAWPDARFEASEDNEDAERWRGEAYALADLLMRGGERLGPTWQAAWSEILPNYLAEMHKSRNAGRAEKAAFGAVDWSAFEAAWQTWVQSHIERR